MQHLPLEIVDRIVHFLAGGSDAGRITRGGRQRIAPYALISSQFLEAVQRRVWRSLFITNYHLAECARYLQGRRPGCLRKLKYCINLSVVETANLQRYERPVETAAVSDEFRQHLDRLFDMLHGLDRNCAQGSGGPGAMQRQNVKMNLRLVGVHHLEAPADMSYHSPNFGRYRHGRTRIALPRADELPMIHCVRRLSFGRWRRQPIPSVQLEIAARMLGLTELVLRLNEYGAEYPALLREGRRSLAEALAIYSEHTKDIIHAALIIPLDGYTSTRQMALPNLTYPQGYELLGSALRKWSQRLTSFRVEGILDGTLFWPQTREKDDKGAADEPEWQSLQYLDVRLGSHTPSGWWYFMPEGDPTYGRPPRDPAVDPKDQPPLLPDNEPTGPPDPFLGIMDDDSDSDDEERMLRSVPHEDTMQPLFEAWAKALGRMPSLRTARLRFQTYKEEWEVVYEAPGYKDTMWYSMLGLEERGCRRLVFHNTGDWRPVEKTMNLLLAKGSVSWSSTHMIVLTAERNKIVREVGM
ncbi:glycoside hydrolase family 3 protein [Apiospora arundinis]